MSNTGNCNTGDRNTGDCNTGYCNTGNCNTGYCNTGNCNTGDRNTGDCNTGYCNTGDRNTGNRNTGNRNTGNRNTGDWNTGDWNTGYFCVEDGPVIFFDVAVQMSREEAEELIPYVELPVGAKWTLYCDMTAEQKASYPNSEHIGGCLEPQALTIQDAMSQAWPTLDVETRRKFLTLPHFDADKFLKCTGVDVRLDRDLFPVADATTRSNRRRINIDGVWYVQDESQES